MGNNGEEAIGSMGTDTPLAVLSDRAQPLFNYFKQLFAQVTNPPLDAIREELVTSVLTGAGGEGNLLDADARELPPDRARHAGPRQRRAGPAQAARRLARVQVGRPADALPRRRGGRRAGAGARRRCSRRRSRRSRTGRNLLILSDRGVDAETRADPVAPGHAPGCTTTWSARGMRTRAGLVVECGDAREVHHFALLLGYGAGSINPYVAFETLDDMISQGMIKPEIDHAEAVYRYRKAIKKGVVKVMSKMGISTIQSYRGAQIFEAIGLNQEFIDKYFDKTASRIGGVGLEEIARGDALPPPPRLRRPRGRPGDARGRAASTSGAATASTTCSTPRPSSGSSTPPRPAATTSSRSTPSWSTSRTSGSAPSAGSSTSSSTAGTPVPIEEVEPVESIVKRFATGAMSYGSISGEAHETLAIAMNRIGGKSNTGEGGEDPARFKPLPNGDSKRSAIKQVASGRFGVTSEYLVNADELQIKMAQGAKPGEGGQLPGHKVWPWIAKVRYSTPGVGLISPPPHHDIYSIEDLAQLIHDLKNSNPRARISVKLVAEVGVGTVAAGVAKAHSDVVLISGHDGGTGASPLTSLKHAGIPWELGLAETQQTLVLNRLRDRIVVQTDGQMKTGRDVVDRRAAGGRGVRLRHGAAGRDGLHHDAGLPPRHLPGRHRHPEPQAPREVRRARPSTSSTSSGSSPQEVRELMAQLGFRTIDEMIGRSDLLDMKRAHRPLQGPRARLQQDLLPARRSAPTSPSARSIEQDHGLDKALDQRALAPGRAGPGARRAGRDRRCRSATSTGPSARSSAAS